MNNQIFNIVRNQRIFYNTNKTRNIEFRINQLIKLKKLLKKYEREILISISKDTGKVIEESYLLEVLPIYLSINNFIKMLKKYKYIQQVKTPFYLLNIESYVMNEPYGVIGIISASNYPFLLSVEPLLGAIVAGNTAIIKISEKTKESYKILNKIFSENFSEKYIKVVIGDSSLVHNIIDCKVDKVFFTGSSFAAKSVLETASKNMIPVTIEAGGKNPVIIDETADLILAAKKIVWAKFSNNGRTCIAPDYILVKNTVKKEFIKKLIYIIEKFYTVNIKNSKYYGRIVNNFEFERLVDIIEKDKKYIIYGGEYDKNVKYIQPTILLGSTFEEMECMKDEIFGPILPIFTYINEDEVSYNIKKLDKPLMLYIFSKNLKNINKLSNTISSGNLAINETLLYMSNFNLPFGGVGLSGMGSYHGKYSFNEFSRKRGIIYRKHRELVGFYPPYTLLKKIYKIIRLL